MPKSTLGFVVLVSNSVSFLLLGFVSIRGLGAAAGVAENSVKCVLLHSR